MAKKPHQPAQPRKYIVEAGCTWYDAGIVTSNPSIQVVSTDPAKAVQTAEKELKETAGRRHLLGFRVDRIIDQGPARREDNACTIGLL